MIGCETKFFERLKLLTSQHGSVTQFARDVGIGENTVRNWNRNKLFPSVELLVLICAKCHVSADWLIGLSDNREPNWGEENAVD